MNFSWPRSGKAERERKTNKIRPERKGFTQSVLDGGIVLDLHVGDGLTRLILSVV